MRFCMTVARVHLPSVPMKSEQALFGERFRAALKSTGYPESPSELCRQLTKHGGEPTTPQAVSSWLRGKSVPRQRNMRALAKMLRMDPVALLFGSTETGKRVREPVAEFRVNAQDQHAVDAFLVLNIRKRKLVRELIELLSEYERKR